MSSNNFVDLPAGTRIEIPITFGDRIAAVCWDVHYCTIANGICRLGRKIGIVSLEKVSRTVVRVYLDPKVYPWAVKGQEYRGFLTPHSADVAKELDDYVHRPAEHTRLKNMLSKAAATTPNGLNTIFDTIVIMAPPPSQAKGYRAGFSGSSRPGTHPKTAQNPNAPTRRYSGRPARLVRVGKP